MSIQMCVLASGSGGNCTVVRCPTGVMLIDAGVGPRTAADRLQGTGVGVREVASICLTHLDRDHFTPAWCRTVRRQGIRLFCHAARLADVRRLGDGLLDDCLIGFTGAFEPLPGLVLHSIALAHDVDGSHGFLIEGFGARFGYATDLGRVPAHLIERFVGVDVLALESNYDPDMQASSGRPWFLQRRITGGRGHLSNEQAFDAIRQILDRCQAADVRLPRHVVLLHRSRQCNCPDRVRHVFAADHRIAPRLTLAEQFERSPWLTAGAHSTDRLIGRQLSLAWTAD